MTNTKSLLKLTSLFLLILTSSAPSASEITLEDLGFNENEMMVDNKTNAILEERNWKLKYHQNTALAALVLMTGAVLTSGHGESTETHKNLGIASGLTYYTAAYFAITAPEVKNVETRGNTKLHKWLAWIHGPAMILTPILGHLANESYKKGKLPTGIEKHHNAIAFTGYFAFLASGLTMTFEF